MAGTEPSRKSSKRTSDPAAAVAQTVAASAYAAVGTVMKFGHFFVDRPIFASVVSIVVVIIGIIAFYQLPVSEYPEIAPPQINVTTNYPGADAETVARTVATPIEQAINEIGRAHV